MCSSEIWKDIKDYEGLYQVSSLGRVKRISDGLILHQSNSAGYKTAVLIKDGTPRMFSVHRLVAFAFCEGYKEGMVVNHINELKYDNRAENLEWCNASYNVTYNDSQLKGRMRASTRPTIDEKRKQICSMLRDLRKHKGMKVGEAALKAAISESTLNLIESGTQSTSFDTLESIANVYGYTLILTEKD